jgi:hypothetical protein
LNIILDALKSASIVLTPHIQSPIPADGKKPLERNMLAAGMFNGGFIGFSNDAVTKQFFGWWKERMIDQAFIDPANGMFYDQNWLNLVPMYFDNVTVIRDAGHNVAYWNLHERKIEKQGNEFAVNGSPLTFFHFSGLDPFAENISKHQDRFDLKHDPVVAELFTTYRKKLVGNEFAKFSQLSCAYGLKPKKHSAPKKIMMQLFRTLGYEIKKTN